MRLGLAAVLAGAVIAAGAAAPGRAQEAPPAPPQDAPPFQPQLQPPAAGPNTTSTALPPEEAPAPPPQNRAPPAAEEPPPPPPKPVEPLKRTRRDSAILQATDKITAATLRFEARVGQPVRYKDLVITVRACETTAPDEPVADSVASLDVVSQPTATAGRTALQPRQVYKGWMFAVSPSLHPFEHPVYDLTLIACRTTSGPAVAGKP